MMNGKFCRVQVQWTKGGLVSGQYGRSVVSLVEFRW